MLKILNRSFSVLYRLITASYHMIQRDFSRGWCPICEKMTIFYQEGEWLRDHLRCIRCYSIPRWRAIIHVLNMHFPDWRKLHIHEAAPAGAASSKLRQECQYYVGSCLSDKIPIGQFISNLRCEDLERQSFSNESFDLVITQDVFEHVLDPARAFQEIARTLKPGGAHVFSVPWYPDQDTVVRAIRTPNGLKNLKEPLYHGDPFSAQGALVVTDWGKDICHFILQRAKMMTEVINTRNPYLGIEGEFLDIFISRKEPVIGMRKTI